MKYSDNFREIYDKFSHQLLMAFSDFERKVSIHFQEGLFAKATYELKVQTSSLMKSNLPNLYLKSEDNFDLVNEIQQFLY